MSPHMFRSLASSAIGLAMMALPYAATAQVSEMQTDVVVVGAGSSGLSAALTASQGGLKVVLLEKNRMPGGTSNAAEGIFVVGSKMQRSVNDTTTLEEVFKIEMEYGNHWQGNADLYRTYLLESAKTYDWLIEQGVRFERTGITAPEDRQLRTWHLIVGHGHGLIEALFGKAKADPNITIMLETPGKELITEGGRVLGAVAKKKTGEELRIKAKAVVIATGGYAEDPKMVAKYQDSGDAGAGALVPFNKTGDGLKMAMAAGTAVEGMSHMQWAPGVESRKAPLPMTALAWEPDLMWVNRFGKRFADESIGRNFSLAGNAIRRQGYAWVLVPEKKVKDVTTDGLLWGVGVLLPPAVAMPDLPDQLKKGMQTTASVVEAANADELAAKIKVPAAALKAAIAQYNHAIDVNYDDLYFKPRQYMSYRIEGHLYALKSEPQYLASLGGAVVNTKLQAQDKNLNAIPGLYVVGNDAVGGLFGDTYPLDVPGTTFGFAVNSGRLAGRAMLEELKR
jgi:fumarate reductase flavoprotein subunit